MLKRRVAVSDYETQSSADRLPRPAGYQATERTTQAAGYPVDERANRDEVVQESSGFAVDPASIAAYISGFILLMFGLLALVRGGFDGFPRELVTLGGLTVTTMVALCAAVVGAGLLLSGASGYAGRSGTMFLSGLLVVAGIIIVIDTTTLPAAFVAEDSFGWLIGLVGAATLAISALVPARRTSRSYIRRSVRGM
jgi:hypothetical protein